MQVGIEKIATFDQNLTCAYLVLTLCGLALRSTRMTDDCRHADDCRSVECCQQLATVEYVDNDNRRLRLYQSMVTPKRTEQNLFLCVDLINLTTK